MKTETPIEFPGNQRVHIALAVTDLARSRTFYETLLGESPAKERPGYVKFEPQDPSLNLTLNEVSESPGVGQGVAHYGIQVKTTQAVQSAIGRLAEAG